MEGLRIIIKHTGTCGQRHWRWDVLSKNFISLAGGDGLPTCAEAMLQAQRWVQNRGLEVSVGLTFCDLNGGKS